MKAPLPALAILLGLVLCGPAAASAADDLRAPDQVSPALVVTQDLRAPDQVATTGGTVAAAPAATLAPDATGGDGGLETLWIVLIATGGALALGGAAYSATRMAHRRGHAVG